jgi:hypothetical protein
MTREQLKTQALGRLKLSLRPDLIKKASVIADEILEPYKKRDEAEYDGKKGEPYRFDGNAVLWLERKIRERLKL